MNFNHPILAFFGDIGAGEVLVIMAAVLILFGGKGLPSIARKLGKMSQDLQKATRDFKNQLLTADHQPPPEPHDHKPLSPDDKDADKS
ncbi:MAG: twin-arginine translocase TatA/TatE family subunit [bacterium]